MTDTILQVEGLRTHFTTRHGVIKAVDGLSFGLDAGTTLCIVGESGSEEFEKVCRDVEVSNPP